MQRRFLRKRGTAGEANPLRHRCAMPPPPKGGGFALLTGRCQKAPPERIDFPRPGEDVTTGDKRGNLSPQVTERVSLRTLPKKAGNISLSLREWGLFCIESHLQGAGGV